MAVVARVGVVRGEDVDGNAGDGAASVSSGEFSQVDEQPAGGLLGMPGQFVPLHECALY